MNPVFKDVSNLIDITDTTITLNRVNSSFIKLFNQDIKMKKMLLLKIVRLLNFFKLSAVLVSMRG